MESEHRSVHLRDNFGVVNLGDGVLVVQYGDLSREVQTPKTLVEATHTLFGPPVPAVRTASVIRWLAADADVIPQRARAYEAELISWARGNSAGSVMRLVAGPGGQGKTVLGSRVAEAIRGARGVAGFVSLPPASWRIADPGQPATAATSARWITAWATTIAATIAAATLSEGHVLLIVDYADEETDAVADLLGAILASPAAVARVRVLLLARDARTWWAELLQGPHHRWLESSPLHLKALSDELDREQLAEAWQSAVAAFSRSAAAAGWFAEGLPPQLMGGTRTPDSFKAPPAQTTLDLYAQALLTVLDAAAPGGWHDQVEDPLAGVLNHEVRIVKHALDAAGAELAVNELAQAMLAAFLFPARSVAEGIAVLARCPALIGRANRKQAALDILPIVAEGLARLYPSTAGELWQSPVPDRLPDTHLLRTLQSESTDADGEAVLTQLIGRVPDQPRGPRESSVSIADPDARGLVTRLGRTLSTPHTRTIYPVGVRRLTSAVIDLFSADPVRFTPEALQQDHRGLDSAIIAAITTADRAQVDLLNGLMLRRGFSLTRAHLAVQISERLTYIWSQDPPNTAEAQAARSADIGTHAIRLAEAGQRDQALIVSGEAVTLRRELAALNRDAYLPNLAMSVNNHAAFLAEAGQRDQALIVSGEAVTLRRELAALNRDAYLPDLAASVNNHAIRLAEAGQRDQALIVSGEAVTHYRELAALNRDAYLPNLAMSVNNHAIRLAEAGQRDQALIVSGEAVTLRRELAALNRDAYLPNLAMSVNNHAIRLAEAGQRDQALIVSGEAVTLRRELAALNRDAYLPNLAMSVNNHAAFLAEAGQRDQALIVSGEAVTHYRELAALNRDAYLPDLAMSVNNHAAFLAEAGQRDQALIVSGEAVTLRRELAALNRDAYLPDLAASVNNHAIRLAEAGQRDQALIVSGEAVTHYRELAALNRDAYLPNLAASVNNHAIRLAEAGQRDQALIVSGEAVTHYRELAALNRDAYLPDLAMSVNNHAIRLAEAGQRDQALTIWAEHGSALAPEALGPWEVLRAAWQWTGTPDYQGEEEQLTRDAEHLLSRSHTDWVLQVLRHKPIDEAHRYLQLIDKARATSVSKAYAAMREMVADQRGS